MKILSIVTVYILVKLIFVKNQRNYAWNYEQNFFPTPFRNLFEKNQKQFHFRKC